MTAIPAEILALIADNNPSTAHDLADLNPQVAKAITTLFYGLPELYCSKWSVCRRPLDRFVNLTKLVISGQLDTPHSLPVSLTDLEAPHDIRIDFTGFPNLRRLICPMNSRTMSKIPPTITELSIGKLELDCDIPPSLTSLTLGIPSITDFTETNLVKFVARDYVNPTNPTSLNPSFKFPKSITHIDIVDPFRLTSAPGANVKYLKCGLLQGPWPSADYIECGKVFIVDKIKRHVKARTITECLELAQLYGFQCMSADSGCKNEQHDYDSLPDMELTMWRTDPLPLSQLHNIVGMQVDYWLDAWPTQLRSLTIRDRSTLSSVASLPKTLTYLTAPWPSIVPERASTPHLRECHIFAIPDGDCVVTMETMINFLDAPNLQSLTITASSFGNPDFTPFTKLQKLHIVGRLTHPMDERLLYVPPTLTELFVQSALVACIPPGLVKFCGRPVFH